MNSERWEQIKTLVADALEVDAAERPAFIRQRCGSDLDLAGEAESMLAGSGDRLEIAARSLHSPVHDHGSLTGQRLGAYEVLSEIGRGGMGAVYLARRADQEFEKQVAIKLLKRGTDTDEVLRRFRAERQILARLEHPNIARLIDAGTSADGLPYFAMEYVEGVPITDFCLRQNLNTRERVELVLHVCAAVQFAHQNLVVHRDLKPRNILVTADGVPKLLDFGIAKLLSDDSDALQLTVQGGQRLTPGYASPEQVRGDVITTASDVYSLGALLYELLAGAPPHRFETQNPSPGELQRVIGEVEPARLASAPTDLDTIARKALSKEPARRYSGVAALADDLRRHLDGRPVRARPATLGYRASRFVARNKLAVAAAVLLFLAITGGVAATLWQAREAQRQASFAQQQAALAQKRFQDVRKLARAVVFDYHDLIAELRGSTPVRERLVKDALEYLDSLSRETTNDSGLLRELGSAYEKIAKIQGNSYYPNLGDTAGALQSYRKGRDIQEKLLAADPTNPELIDETAYTYVGLGDVLYEREELHAALAEYERALQLREPLFARRPDDLQNRLNLAEAYTRVADLKGFEHYSNLGDPAGGLAAAQRACELHEPAYAQDPHNRHVMSRFANALVHLGVLSCSTGNPVVAIDAQRKAVAMLEAVAAREPNSQQIETELLAARHFLRFSLEDNDQLREAMELSRRIVADLERMVAADEKNALFRRNLALSYSALGKQLLQAGDVSGALGHHRRAVQMLDERLAADANSLSKKKDAAAAHARLGDVQAANGEFIAAAQSFRHALSLLDPVLAADAKNARVSDEVAKACAGLGKTLASLREFDQARDAFARSVAIAQETSRRAPTNARLRAHLAERLADVADFYRTLGDTSHACAHLTRSRDIWRELREGGTLLPATRLVADRIDRQLVECTATASR